MSSLIRRFGAAAIAFAALLPAGCRSDTPTAPVDADSDARFEGGIGFGSGNFVGTSSNTTATADSGSTANKEGGIGFGSGN